MIQFQKQWNYSGVIDVFRCAIALSHRQTGTRHTCPANSQLPLSACWTSIVGKKAKLRHRACSHPRVLQRKDDIDFKSCILSPPPFSLPLSSVCLWMDYPFLLVCLHLSACCSLPVSLSKGKVSIHFIGMTCKSICSAIKQKKRQQWVQHAKDKDNLIMCLQRYYKSRTKQQLWPRRWTSSLW